MLKILVMDDVGKTRSGFKVAIIDNCNFSQQIITNTLRAAGFSSFYSVTQVTREFLNERMSNVGVYIINFVMPERSGLEVANIIINSSIKGKVIMTSSLVNKRVIIDSLAIGASDFLVKPFNTTELLRAVERVERGRSLVDETKGQEW